jgi:hypothetical protein
MDNQNHIKIAPDKNNLSFHFPPLENKHFLLLILLLAGFVWRGVFIYRDLDWLTNYWLFEDWGYSLKIARNLAAGLGETYDGVVKTNGYQPLYVWLMIPVYWIFQKDIYTPIYIAITMLAICNVLTGFYIYKTINLFTDKKFWGFFGLGFWLFNLNIARSGTLGLESGLSVFLVSVTIYYTLAYKDELSYKKSLILGFLLAFSFLARVDAVFLIASVFGYLFILKYRSLLSDIKHLLMLEFKLLKEDTKHLLVSGLPIIVLVGSYLLYNKIAYGYSLPTSGLVIADKKSLFSLVFFINFHNIMYGIYITSMMLIGKMTINGFRYYDEFWGTVTTLTNAFILEATICYLIFAMRNRRQYIKKYLLFFLVFATYFYGYTVYLFAAFERYFLPLMVVIVILISLLLAFIFSYLEKQSKYLSGVVACVMSIALLSLFIYGSIPHLTSNFSYTSGWKKGIEALNEIADEGDVVAALQAGNLGYLYTKGRAINLDGVVNIPALKARLNKNMFNYLRDNQVKYLADEKGWIFHLLQDFQSQSEKDIYVSNLKLLYRATHFFRIYEYVDYGYVKFINLADYKGQWESKPDIRMVNGNSIFSETKGAFIEFVSSNSFDIKMLKHDWSGIVNFYVNGDLYDSIDLFSLVQDSTFKYRFENTTGQQKFFKLEVSGEKNQNSKSYQVWLDAILEYLPSMYSSKINFGEPSAQWIKTGSWQTTTDARMINEDVFMSFNHGDTVEFSSSKSFHLKMLKHDWSGIANIYMDDEIIDRIDLYSESQNPDYFYQFKNIDGQQHRFKIEVSGEKNPNSRSYQVWVDALLEF